jgi:hypothetical protein
MTEIHQTELQNKNSSSGFNVTSFPVSSLGKSFTFQVEVRTAYSDIKGLNSEPLLLAGVPGKP